MGMRQERAGNVARMHMFLRPKSLFAPRMRAFWNSGALLLSDVSNRAKIPESSFARRGYAGAAKGWRYMARDACAGRERRSRLVWN